LAQSMSSVRQIVGSRFFLVVVVFSFIPTTYPTRRDFRTHSKYLVEALSNQAISIGDRVTAQRFSYYNPHTFTVYISSDGGQVYRVSPDKVDVVDNGTDGVLFMQSPTCPAFELAEAKDDTRYFEDQMVSQINFEDDILSSEERGLLFSLWYYSLFFESIMPTKPILAFIGEKGSGKSITARKVGRLLFGPTFNVTPLSSDVRDFDASVSNAYYLVIDNVDERCNWLCDRLAILATGGSIKKGELYTTNTMVEIPTKCYLAITSRTPDFRRDDVADRLLIMKVKRYMTFKAENSILKEVDTNRDAILSETIWRLQAITRALRAADGKVEDGVFRMVDFADFAIKTSRCFGKEDQIRRVFDKLSREQSFFALENDPVFYLLSDWVAQNQGREISNASLCDELSALASKQHTDFPYTGKGRAFAQRMALLRPALSEHFAITERSVGGHNMVYCYRLR